MILKISVQLADENQTHMTAPRLIDDPARRDQILTTLAAWMDDDVQVRAAQDRAVEPREVERFVRSATKLGEAKPVGATC